MVFEKIREIIAEQTGKDEEEITLDTNVKDDLDADSLDLFQIINDIAGCANSVSPSFFSSLKQISFIE